MLFRSVHHYIVHPAKLAAGLPTGILLLWSGAIQLSTRLWWCGLLFIAFGVLFLMVAALYGRVVHVGPSGVRWTLLGRELRSRTWEQIGEIGVVGTRVFNGNSGNGPAAPSGQGGREGLFGPAKRSSIGTPYLYFSEEPLTEEQRFTLALKWPPRDMIFLRFTPERVAHVQSSSQKYVEHYNTGDLTF